MIPPLHILRTRLEVPGLQKPLRILHATDVHLCECDDRDPRQQKFLAYVEEKQGGMTLARFDALLAMIPQLEPDFLAFTGDFVDSFTHANWEALSQRLKRLPIPYGLTFGNHDWDLPELGTQKRDLAYRRKLHARFVEQVGRNPAFEQFLIGGVRLVFLDNSDYQVLDAQLQALDRVLRGDERVILFFHIPISEPALRPLALEKWFDPILCGDPDWEPLRRRRWRVLPEDTPFTKKFRSRVMKHASIAGAFTGHLHLNHHARLPGGALHVVTPALYEGHARLITLEPAKNVKTASRRPARK